MSYEVDPAGLGVGKRYGPLALGGVGGVTKGDNGQFRWVAEVSAKELEANASVKFNIPDGKAIITAVYVEVEDAFTAADVVDVFYDGVTILGAPVAADAETIASGTLAVSPTVIDVDKDITIDVSGLTAGVDGYAKVVVVAERI